ncbi:hypothetical protein Dsin_010837 [Dipteronia sinensis]|uniref:Uncharacterized protein n=1 Tax=Dipteronia sinensis TaxID=43782 RepID=A0AAE0AUG1_9ROSI|nr:hypothetical protein Dsin_010837 [Dipteronia sinensis]
MNHIDHFHVQRTMIFSEGFSDFFQRQKFDEALLKKLKKKMKTIDSMLPVDSFYQVIIESGDWVPWLNLLHGIILDLDDLLHEVAKVEAKFKIITTLWSYCRNLTFRIFLNKYRPSTSLEKGIEERMKDIIKEMKYLAGMKIYDSFEHEFEVVFGIEDKARKEKLDQADKEAVPNGTDLNEMPAETSVGSTPPPESCGPVVVFLSVTNLRKRSSFELDEYVTAFAFSYSITGPNSMLISTYAMTEIVLC